MIKLFKSDTEIVHTITGDADVATRMTTEESLAYSAVMNVSTEHDVYEYYLS